MVATCIRQSSKGGTPARYKGPPWGTTEPDTSERRGTPGPLGQVRAGNVTGERKGVLDAGSIPAGSTVIWGCGGIGRRAGFKIRFSQEGVGSSPTIPTLETGNGAGAAIQEPPQPPDRRRSPKVQWGEYRRRPGPPPAKLEPGPFRARVAQWQSTSLVRTGSAVQSRPRASSLRK